MKKRICIKFHWGPKCKMICCLCLTNCGQNIKQPSRVKVIKSNTKIKCQPSSTVTERSEAEIIEKIISIDLIM